jgi:GntR family transcriptional regulator
MNIMDFNHEKPIYIQLAEWIEDAILSGVFAEDQQVPSTTELSVNYKINPATALKAISILVDSGILYKKRGLGMFVCVSAKEKIFVKRKSGFLENYIDALVDEAKKLGVSQKELLAMVERSFLK